MPYPLVLDIAVVQKIIVPGKNPIGEAPKQGDSLIPLTPVERQSMLDRIYLTVERLAEMASSFHDANKNDPSANTVNPNFITRLSTDEFFFTQKNHLPSTNFKYYNKKS